MKLRHAAGWICMGVAAAAPAAAGGTNAAPAWSGELQAGAGAAGGNVTYEIGRWVDAAGGRTPVDFPISRLEWPADTTLARLDGRIACGRRWELRGNVAFNAGADAGTVKDSDWADYQVAHQRVIYSENDTELDAWAADASVRYRLLDARRGAQAFGLSVGAGWLRQRLDWKTTGGLQSYPADPGTPADPIPAGALRYTTETDLPYVEAVARWAWKRWAAEARGAYAPLARVADRDDHVLRGILSTTDADGMGALAELRLRWEFAPRWFAEGGLQLARFEADGVSKNRVYGGDDPAAVGDTWEIYERIRSTQLAGTLSVGRRF